MSLPDEKYRAVKYAREFLRDLLNPKTTPGVTKKVRERAYRVLRHYPSHYDMDVVSANLPTLFSNEEGMFGGPAASEAERDIAFDSIPTGKLSSRTGKVVGVKKPKKRRASK